MGDTKPVAIDDNLRVVGGVTATAATIGGLPVTGIKRYSGTFNTSLDGDIISTLTFASDCMGLAGTAQKVQATHYKAIAIPEVTLSALPDIRVFYRTQTATLYVPPMSSCTPTVLSNNNDNWLPLNAYLNEGKIYIMFKIVMT